MIGPRDSPPAWARGIERGDLRADADSQLVNELLFAPVYYRLVLSGAPLDDNLAERIVSSVFPAFTTGGEASPRPRGKRTARRPTPADSRRHRLYLSRTLSQSDN